MGKKPGDGKIGGVKSSVVKPTDTAKEIAGTSAVSEVGEVSGVKATAAVGSSRGVGEAGRRRRSTRTMSLEERDHLMQVVQQEAEKMFNSLGMSASRKKTVTEAVKMAIDAGLIAEEDKEK